MKVKHTSKNGFTWVADLPKGYDKRTELTYFNGAIIAVHPEQKPIRVTPDGKVETIEPAHAPR